MSYILEALKKSERERGHGRAPGIQSVHSAGISYEARRRPLWPYILTIAVIINMAALVYFYVADVNSTTTASVNDAVGAPPAQAEWSAAAVPTPEQIPVASPPVTEAKPATGVAAKPPVRDPEPEWRTPVSAAQAPPPMASAGSGKAIMNNSTTMVSAGDYTPQREDLPPAIRQQLPVLEFSAHVYSSNPVQRSIVINGRFMEEGEMLGPDFILSEITPGGAVFDFQGYRYHETIVSSWN